MIGLTETTVAGIVSHFKVDQICIGYRIESQTDGIGRQTEQRYVP